MTINLLFLNKPFLLPSQQRQGLMGQFLENYYIFDCLKFIYWCEVFSENTWIKQEYFSANKELNFLFDKKFSAYLPSDFISQWARTVKPGLMILIQYFLLMASPSLALISLHVSAGSSGMEPRATGRKICHWQWMCVKYLFKREPLGGALRDLSESLLVTTSSVFVLWVLIVLSFSLMLVESDSCSSHIFDCALQYCYI